MARFDHRATKPARTLRDVLRWRAEPLFGASPPATEPWEVDVPAFDAGQLEPDARFETPRTTSPLHLLAAPEPALTWVGHASFMLRLGGLCFSLDPVWRGGFGPRRRHAAPGLPLAAAATHTDVVLVSHNHFDHLDLPTLSAFGARPLYVVPLGNARFLEHLGAEVVELDWWGSRQIQVPGRPSVRVTLVPARHWSMRMPWTRNEALWGGFVIESEEGVAYHSGDTAYFDGFSEIAARFPRIDWAMLPIGAYDPRWFMRPQHMCPEEAGQAFLDLRARHLVAMHWGTFKLTDEPLSEPPLRLRHWATAMGLSAEQVWVMAVGERRTLSPAP